MFWLKGCEFPNYYGDGSCDDENNNEACCFDGGDCCGSNVDTQWCTECQCLEGLGGSGTTCGGGCIQNWVTDGYCDDMNNHLDCNFDGGDCCGSNVNTQYCTQCQCLE